MADPATRQLHIAKWSTRFWAWLIDVIVVGAVVNAFWGAVGVMAVWSVNPFLLGDVGEFGSLNGLGLWVYWMLLDGYRGQSIGKLVLNLKVTDRAGNQIDYGAAAIESFGKAFLLPIDLIIGALVYEGKKLRLFNRLSETIVIETETESLEPPDGVEYILPDE